MDERKTIIAFENVSFAYDGSASKAIDDISLDVLEGEFLCLLGGNGSGKTTLAKMINALLLPSSGKVTVCGLDTTNPGTLFDIRQSAGMVFQNPDDQMVGNSVEDDVAFGPENLCLPSEEIQDRVISALDQVGLRGFGKHQIGALSGGQKQRVSIAAALAMRPKILVLDEAGSMLDPRGRSELLKACKQLNKDELTIVYVTHFLEEAVSADRVAVLQDGKLAVTGLPDEILENQSLLQSLNLEAPFPVEMSSLLISKGSPVKMHLTSKSLADDLKEKGFSPDAASQYIDFCVQKAQVQDSSESVIALEDVSYSYFEKRDLKRELKRKRKNALSEGDRRAEYQKGDAKNAPKWGSDPASVWALKNLSLTVNQGDFLGIIGHTGSGKSTLLKILAGLVKPFSGQLLFGSKNEGAQINNASTIREYIGIVMQYPEKQLFAETVYKDCAFGPRNLGLSEAEVEKRVREALNLVGLDDSYIEKSPFQLSGGQQRRVAIAGVLAMEPKVLILDEPTVGLDPKGCRLLLKLIKKLHEENGITIIMVSHNMDNIANLCSKVLVLNKGEELISGSPIDVFSNEKRLKSIGLSLPSIIQLCEELNIHSLKNVPNIEQLSNAIAEGMRLSSSATTSTEGASSYSYEERHYE